MKKYIISGVVGAGGVFTLFRLTHLFIKPTGLRHMTNTIFRLDAHYSQTYLCALTK